MDWKQISNYGPWDLHCVRTCDVAFGYLEATNPGGMGLATELGYAKGLGKTVVLCIEPVEDEVQNRYRQFPTKVADWFGDEFGAAVVFLASLPSCRVYLAGGMRTSWREMVKQSAPQHTYFSPMDR